MFFFAPVQCFSYASGFSEDFGRLFGGWNGKSGDSLCFWLVFGLWHPLGLRWFWPLIDLAVSIQLGQLGLLRGSLSA